MTDIRQVTINGRQVWVEVSDVHVSSSSKSHSDDGLENTSSCGQAGTALAEGDIAGALQAVVEPIQNALKSVAPSELSVELKLGFKADAGVFIAKTSGEASLTVKAVWKPTGAVKA